MLPPFRRRWLASVSVLKHRTDALTIARARQLPASKLSSLQHRLRNSFLICVFCLTHAWAWRGFDCLKRVHRVEGLKPMAGACAARWHPIIRNVHPGSKDRRPGKAGLLRRPPASRSLGCRHCWTQPEEPRGLCQSSDNQFFVAGNCGGTGGET